MVGFFYVIHMLLIVYLDVYCGGPFLCSTELPPAILGPSVLSKGVETGPTETQLGSACVRTIPRLPRAYLQQVELF